MRDVIDEIRSHGAELIVVGNGKPHHAATFKEDERLDFPLYVDPSLKAYEAAGLKRSVASTFTPTLLGKTVKAYRKGMRQRAVQGDPWQQGGVFVIAADGRTVFHHINHNAGDHAGNEAILAALKEAAGD